jgi:hypothetical protein
LTKQIIIFFFKKLIRLNFFEIIIFSMIY